MIHSDFSEDKSYIKNHSYVITWKVVMIANMMSALALFALVKFAELIDGSPLIGYLVVGVAMILLSVRFVRRKILNK